MNLRGREGGAMPELDEVVSLRAAEGGSSRSYIAGTLKSQRGKGGGGIGPEETLVAETLREHPRPGSNSDGQVVAFHATQDPVHHHHHTPALSAESSGNLAVDDRRLTPTECERLQGFPDGWTQLGDTADARRYSALGDAVTVNVAAWIGERLASRAREPEAVTPTEGKRPSGG